MTSIPLRPLVPPTSMGITWRPKHSIPVLVDSMRSTWEFQRVPQDVDHDDLSDSDPLSRNDNMDDHPSPYSNLLCQTAIQKKAFLDYRSNGRSRSRLSVGVTGRKSRKAVCYHHDEVQSKRLNLTFISYNNCIMLPLAPE